MRRAPFLAQRIEASGGAFAALLDDGSVVTWGEASAGGDSRPVQELPGPGDHSWPWACTRLHGAMDRRWLNDPKSCPRKPIPVGWLIRVIPFLIPC